MYFLTWYVYVYCHSSSMLHHMSPQMPLELELMTEAPSSASVDGVMTHMFCHYAASAAVLLGTAQLLPPRPLPAVAAVAAAAAAAAIVTPASHSVLIDLLYQISESLAFHSNEILCTQISSSSSEAYSASCC